MAKSERCRNKKSKEASRWVTTATAVLGTVTIACFAQTANGADEQGWQHVVPSTTALPSVEPPSSFNRSANNILPTGTTDELSDALPNRLQTNKFYSNFLVSQHAVVQNMHPLGCDRDHSVARTTVHDDIPRTREIALCAAHLEYI